MHTFSLNSFDAEVGLFIGLAIVHYSSDWS